MPDLITHMAFNHILRRSAEVKEAQWAAPHLRVLFYLGTLLPDISSRALNIAFPDSIQWTLALHTPAGSLCLIAIMAMFFEPKLRKAAFINLSAGMLLHYLLDTFQSTSTAVFFWLFPFSWLDCGLYLFDPGDLIPLIPVWLLSIVLLELSLYFIKRRKA